MNAKTKETKGSASAIAESAAAHFHPGNLAALAGRRQPCSEPVDATGVVGTGQTTSVLRVLIRPDFTTGKNPSTCAHEEVPRNLHRPLPWSVPAERPRRNITRAGAGEQESAWPASRADHF
jgi:hypothetical protein